MTVSTVPAVTLQIDLKWNCIVLSWIYIPGATIIALSLKGANTMKSLFSILSLFVFLSCYSCANLRPFDDWDTTERIMFAANSVVRTVDMLQTNDIFHNDEYHENNPFLNFGVDTIGTGFVPVWFIGMTFIEYLLLNNLSHDHRKIWLGLATIFSAGLVMNNNSIGLRMNFKF